MTEDLITWLRAQLDEDEAHAKKDLWCAERATAGGQWQVHYGYNLPDSTIRADGREIGRLTATHGRALADGAEDQHAADAMFVARMVRSAKRRAERMLREVEAKRRIIELHQPYGQKQVMARGEIWACSECGSVDDNPVEWPCDTILLLALPHADRPGYRQEWTP